MDSDSGGSLVSSANLLEEFLLRILFPYFEFERRIEKFDNELRCVLNLGESRIPNHRIRSKLVSLWLGVLVVLTLLLVVEVSIRGLGHWQTWRLNSSEVSERPLILAVGHSHTLGVGAANEDLASFPAVLESLLNTTDRVEREAEGRAGLRVMKAAIAAASSTQLVELAKKRVEQHRPRLLLFWGGEANAISYRGFRSWNSRREGLGLWIHSASQWSRLARWLWILYDDEALRIGGFQSPSKDLQSDAFLTSGTPPVNELGSWELASLYEPYSRDELDLQIRDEVIALMQSQHRRFPDSPIFALAWMNLESRSQPVSWIGLRASIEAVEEAYARLGQVPLLPSLALEFWMDDPQRLRSLTESERREVLSFVQRWSEDARLRLPEAFQDSRWRQRWWASLENSDWGWLYEIEPQLRLQICSFFTEVPIWIHVCLTSHEPLRSLEEDLTEEILRWRLYRESARANPLPRINTLGERLRNFAKRQQSIGKSLEDLEGFKEFEEQMHERLPGWVDLHLLARGSLADWIQHDFEQLRDLTAQFKTQLVIQNYHPLRQGESRPINQIIASATQSLDLSLFDTEKRFREWQERNPKRSLDELYTKLYGANDQHLNEEGYRWLAEGLLPFIKNTIDQESDDSR